ncbi:MAG: xylulokinase, partial [Spirochaetaceae bacterium]|nr:xylulokinase [Spirochaetaceae bacterium]
ASLKALVVDECGNVLAQASRAYSFKSPHPGWAEQDGEDWYRALAEAVREALSRIEGGAVKALALSGQMHGAALLDKNHTLLRPVILHCDTRSAAQVSKLSAFFAENKLENSQYNPVYTGFLLPSLLWAREYEAEIFRQTCAVCLPKDYINLRLTGELASDFSDASGTLAFDVPEFRWTELDALSLPAALFPACYAAAGITGRITKQAAADTGLAEGTPVAAGGADQVMQAIGNGAVRPGQATVNIGSSGQVCFQSAQAEKGADAALNTFCGFRRNAWITMGATMSAGLAVSWFSKNIAGLDYRALDALASSAAPGAGGVLFLPYLNGERTPHLRPDLRAAFLGAGFETGKAEFARAALEGVAFSLRECMELCAKRGLHAEEYIASGGGAQSELWLSIQADVYGAPLKVAECGEQAAMGAAVTAAAAAGLYSGIEEASEAMVRYRKERWMPDAGRSEIYNECYLRYAEASELVGGKLWKTR